MKLVLLFLLSFSVQYGNAKPDIQSIFSFGDSYADTGNIAVMVARNLTHGPIPLGSPPYGMTFFHHPAGRFCDGRIILDFIAKEFGFHFLPPYLAHNGSFKQGTNFAVSGATGLDYSFFVKNNLTNPNLYNTTVNVQLGWFEDLKPSLCNTAKKCRKFFRKSLFFVGEFGINDYNFLLFSGKSSAEVSDYIPTLVNIISNAIEKLIDQGAQTIVVSGMPPYGCLPLILEAFRSTNKMDYEEQTGCLKKYNDLSRYQNSLIRKYVTDTRCKFPRVRIIYADYDGPIIELLKSPKHLGSLNYAGFIDTPLRVCCGIGGQYNFNLSNGCGMPGVKACENPSIYLSWDGTHLTEGAYRYIADGWLHGPYADPPILSDVSYL